MKHKYILNAILVIGCLLLVGCKKEEVNYDEGKVKLDEEIIKIIKEEALNSTETALTYFYEYEVLSASNARLEGGDETLDENIEEFTSVSVTSSKQYDDYNYRVYGTLYGIDKYNREISKDYYIILSCYESKEETCDVQFGGLSIDN